MEQIKEILLQEFHNVIDRIKDEKDLHKKTILLDLANRIIKKIDDIRLLQIELNPC